MEVESPIFHISFDQKEPSLKLITTLDPKINSIQFSSCKAEDNMWASII